LDRENYATALYKKGKALLPRLGEVIDRETGGIQKGEGDCNLSKFPERKTGKTDGKKRKRGGVLLIRREG